ncbi:MAG: hypothetical protein A3B80_04800 [Elusimicrobia bacterium RIFCSPHIGHO2_02_FULL_39_36]|nr:MAG: hypothetical protein A3B80_04800 [Elusimicrobia bacterium RIFCSPHIGHO2_02_FULL_39_36]OGS00926.1 MAG: hypothetical protein A3G85_00395 [Elusimicrobia bacterium RIFCSPLOWO2_12_FULL_39_28]
MNLLGDLPIKCKEDDALERIGFAEHIANGILSWTSDEPLCIALHGPWGSGKTSLINLCLEIIKSKTQAQSLENRPIIMQFQPWIISGQEQLIKSFLTQLRVTLKKPGLSKYAHEAADSMEKYENLLGIAAWFPYVGEPLGKLGKLLAHFKHESHRIAEKSDADLESNKESICSALSELKSPIIITIDDIDRLTSQEIRQLFQLIKAVADFPKTIYILAFDHSLVEKALEPFQSGCNTSYLEKIIQLEFEVPNPSRSKIADVLWSGIDSIVRTIPSEEYEQKRWNEIKFGPLPALFRNIRDVKRYLNSVNFMFPVIKGEVSSVDLLILEAFHVFCPTLYRTIRNSRDVFISDSPMRHQERDDKKKWVDSITEQLPTHCVKELTEMLLHLFPEIESAIRNHSWGNEFFQTWDKNQRICISSYFDFYFQGQLPEGQISAKEVNNISKYLDEPQNLELILKNYFFDDRIRKLLPKIEQYFENNFSDSKLKNLVISLFKVGEDIPIKPDGLSGTPTDWLVKGTIYRLVKKLKQDNRTPFLTVVIESSDNAICYPISLISYIWREWNPTDKKDLTDKEKLVSQEDAGKLKNLALALIKKYQDGALYKTRHLISILYDWERWSSIEEVKSWVNVTIADDKKIPDFLGGCGGFISSSEFGSHFAHYELQISRKDIEQFCDVDELKKKCEQLLSKNPTWLTDQQKEIVSIFLKGIDKKDIWD